MTEIFYTTRGVHWCNKKNRDERVEVLIIHSTRHPSKRAYVDSPRARWWRDRKLEIARVARAHTAHTSDSTHRQITTWQTRTRWSMRHRESATTPFVRLHPPTWSRMRPCARAHTSPPMPRWPGCRAVRCDAAWRQRSRQRRSGWRRPMRIVDVVLAVAASADRVPV